MTDADVEKLIQANEALGSYSNIEDITDCLWVMFGDSIQYNTENNEGDLANSDGATYSFDIYGTPTETESFIIFHNAYVCTGDRVTFIVSKCNEFDVDEYWDKQEAEMDWYATPAFEEDVE